MQGNSLEHEKQSLKFAMGRARLLDMMNLALFP